MSEVTELLIIGRTRTQVCLTLSPHGQPTQSLRRHLIFGDKGLEKGAVSFPALPAWCALDVKPGCLGSKGAPCAMEGTVSWRNSSFLAAKSLAQTLLSPTCDMRLWNSREMWFLFLGSMVA